MNQPQGCSVDFFIL